jgi:hypothetical protein
MNDPGVVCGFERLGDLPRDWERFIDCDRPARDAVRERFTVDELNDEGARGARFFDAVDLRDVRMIERGKPARTRLLPSNGRTLSGVTRRTCARVERGG